MHSEPYLYACACYETVHLISKLTSYGVTQRNSRRLFTSYTWVKYWNWLKTYFPRNFPCYRRTSLPPWCCCTGWTLCVECEIGQVGRKKTHRHRFWKKCYTNTISIKYIKYISGTSLVWPPSTKTKSVLKCMCIEKFICKKHSYLKELLKLFRLTIYNFSISYFVLEILRLNDPNYDITLHNDLLKTLVYLWDYETKPLKIMHVHGCMPQHQPCKSSSDFIW